MKFVLSGFAGVGKSSILDFTQIHHKNVFLCPESAREVNYTKEFYKLENDETNEFFQKSVMDNEIMKIMITHLNSLDNVLYDRCIIDNFSFAELFYGSHKVDYRKFKLFVQETLDRFKIDSIYDSILFIRSTENEDFVLNNILNDPFRKETTSEFVKDFINKSKEWETIYFDIYNEINGISKNIHIIDHFIDNPNYDDEVKKLLDSAFKN
jgi:hypothetical protein